MAANKVVTPQVVIDLTLHDGLGLILTRSKSLHFKLFVVGLEQGSDNEKVAKDVLFRDLIGSFQFKSLGKIYRSSLQINAYTISLLERRRFT